MLLKDGLHRSSLPELFLKPHIPCRAPSRPVGEFSPSRPCRHCAVGRPMASTCARRGPKSMFRRADSLLQLREPVPMKGISATSCRSPAEGSARGLQVGGVVGERARYIVYRTSDGIRWIKGPGACQHEVSGPICAAPSRPEETTMNPTGT